LPKVTEKPNVVIVGAGFAGLEAAKALRNKPVRVTVIDRQNHHVFQPLLYQVATAGLSPANIAAPVRRVLRGAGNVRVVLDEVTGVDLERREVTALGGRYEFDYLVLATGAVT
jgi:NADH dehydrogenase